MSYTDPPTFVADDVLAAADLNILSDDIIDLDDRASQVAFYGVSLLRDTNRSCATATWEDIGWVSAPIDVGTWWTTGATITVPAVAVPSGFSTIAIELHAVGRFAANGTGTRQIHFLVNGAEIETARSYSAISGETTTVEAVAWAEVAAADTIKLQLQQSSGGSLNATYCAMHIKRLGVLS